ncbi:hypothetical protein KP001_12145 [Geomonas subterranea]|uniref:Fibronectin type-III domain-containing protein n=1 Tax=Geomonas subterranea TaxID=2847989 RepID=A0ABX8LB36_9BACT|nr:hypothetical protein [Geomonas subterranea]QXE89211.1 hypothetical protein KP001_12145 [Geomonas subterranea]QXM08677.1 hypothetical protein KP002_17130 [Geomonas subterranea]
MKRRMGRVTTALLLTVTTTLAASSVWAMSVATVNGTYNFMEQSAGFYASTGGGVEDNFHGNNGFINFNGAGACSLTYADQGFGVSIGSGTVQTWPDTASNAACTYTVSPAGTMAIRFPDGSSSNFQVSQNGNVLIAGWSRKEPQGNGTDYWGNQIVAVKKGSGMTNASLNGTFHLVSQEFAFWQDTGSGFPSAFDEIYGNTVIATFDGSGACTVEYTGASFETGVTSNDGVVREYPDTLASTPCSYTVSSTGHVSIITPDGGKDFELSPDGTVLLGGSPIQDVSTGGTYSSADQVVGVKEGGNFTSASVAGKYNFVYQESAFYASNGSVTDGIFVNNGSLVLDATGGCTMSYTGTMFEANLTTNSGVTDQPDIAGPLACSYTISPSGQMTINLGDGDLGTLWFSADGRFLLGGGLFNETTTYGTDKDVFQIFATKGPEVTCVQPSTVTVPAADPDGSYTVSWGASTTKGVTYLLEEATDAGFTENVQSYSTTGVSQLISGKSLGTTYFYRVKATASGYSDSSWKTAAAGCAVPGTALPTLTTLNVPLVDADGDYTVSWSASATPGVTYILEEAVNSTFTTSLREAYRGTDPFAAITGRVAGATYYYRVKTVEGGYKDGLWKSSTTGCAVIGLDVAAAAPASLTVPAADPDGAYTVSWTASTTKGVSYFLEEATDANFTQNVTDYLVTGLSKAFTGKSLGTTYFYRVKAGGSEYVDSAWRNAAAGCAVPGTAIPTLTTLTVPLVDADGSYTVSWSPSTVQGVTYVLQEATTSTFTDAHEVYSGSDASASVSGHNVGTSYFYRVKAVEGGYKDGLWKSSTTGCKVIGPDVQAAMPPTMTVPLGDADGAYTVSWGASTTKGVSYLLEEATDAAFTQNVQDYPVAGLNKAFTGKMLGTTYFYRVKAVHPEYVDSNWKAPLAGCAVPGTVIPTLTTLAVPLVDADGSYAVSWTPSAVPGVTYVLQEATNSTFTAGVREAYRGSEAGAVIADRSAGSSYFYRVKAILGGYKDGAWKTQTTGCKVIGPGVPAAAPLTITVPASDADGSYTVSWGASATKGVTYILEEATDAAFTQNVVDYPVTGINKPFTGKSLGSIYYYRIKAVHPEYADSAWRNGTVPCRVPGTILPTLTTLTVPATYSGLSINLSWSASAATGVTYVVQEATNSTFTAGLREAYSGTETSAGVTVGTSGPTYFYRVKAVATGFKDSAWKSFITGCKYLAP